MPTKYEKDGRALCDIASLWYVLFVSNMFSFCLLLIGSKAIHLKRNWSSFLTFMVQIWRNDIVIGRYLLRTSLTTV